MIFSAFFQFIGITVFGYILFQLFTTIYIRFLYSSKGKIKRILNDKKWVVVTGCTSGIGKGFAVESARRGANIVLVARSKDKLEELAKEIRDRFKVQTKIVIIDFSKKDIDYSELTQTVSSLDVSILVNNVGINTEIPDRYLDTPYNEILDMVHVNVDSLVEVTKAVAPSIVKKDGKGEGLIVNLSSYSASSPVPHMAGYSGTKAFINAFSAALRYEYPNLEVLALNPMLVASQMTHISEKRASLLVCTGERLAQDTYKVYGAPFVPNTYSPYLPHSIQTYIVSLLPEKLQAYLGRNQMITVKKKLIAKFAREGKKQ